MTFLDIFLFPFTVFEYIISLMAWIFLASAVMMTDWYWNLSDKLKEAYKKRWKNT